MLIFYIEGDQSDLEFLRERMQGSLEELVLEYQRNLDGQVVVHWDWQADDGD